MTKAVANKKTEETKAPAKKVKGQVKPEDIKKKPFVNLIEVRDVTEETATDDELAKIKARDKRAKEEAPKRAWSKVKNRRNQDIKETDWMVTRHRDELAMVELGMIEKTSLTEKQYKDLLTHRQALRDINKDFEDPKKVKYPNLK